MLKSVLLLSVAVGLSNCAKIPTKSSLKWATNVLQDKVSVSSLKAIVLGFDYSSDEMKKLKLWERGVVPYYIDVVSFDKVLRDRIRNFLDVTSGLSGLQFLELPQPPEDPDARWVFFVNRRGQLDCADHNLGNLTTTGVQKVVLGYDCMTNRGELAEVVLAVAGIPAQHNAPNRDRYVNINFKHIIPEKRYLFKKVSAGDWLFHDLDYDFASAGHYNFLQHSLDGVATIKPKKPVNVFVGEGGGFSYLDILKLRMLYNFVRRPKVDELGSTCKKLFKPGSNLSKTYPRGNLVEDSIEHRKKPIEYLTANGLPIEETDSKKDSDNDEGKNRNDDGNNGEENKNNSANDNVSSEKVENGPEVNDDNTEKNKNKVDNDLEANENARDRGLSRNGKSEDGVKNKNKKAAADNVKSIGNNISTKDRIASGKTPEKSKNVARSKSNTYKKVKNPKKLKV